MTLPGAITGGLAAGAASEPLLRWDWVARNTELIRELAVQHVELTVVPIALGVALALPMSVAAVRWPRLYPPLLSFTGLLFTIPSLALFVLLMPFTGLSRATPVIGLTIYTLLVLTRNMVEGLRGVSPEVREAAAAMGYTWTRQLLKVELPLALPVIIAGVRIATVTTVGLVTVTAVIGWGGLGQLFIDGFVRRFPTPVVIGLGLSVALAAVADLMLLTLQRLLTPWHREA